MRLLNLTSSSLVVLLCSSFVFLNACSSDGDTRPEHMDAATTQNLEIPPQLTQPDTTSALHLPEPSEKAKAAFADNSSGDLAVKVIAPVFKGIRLKNDSNLYWLEVDSPIEKVWDTLPYFLAAEGIEAERVEKLLGFVDTQWMNEYQISYAGEEPSSWLKKFSPDYKDKFRLRLEKIDQDKTRLFVNHRGVQIAVAGDSSEWGQRDSEPMLEREIMYRYMLFAGADKQSATGLLAGYKSYQSRVISNSEQLASFQVQGDGQTVWRRLKVAMDRLGVDVQKIDETGRNIEVLVGNLKVAKPADAEDSSWFGGIFGRDINVDDDNNDNYDNGEYKEAIIKVENRVKLTVHQVAGPYISEIKLESDGELKGIALNFRRELLNQLK
jgi:outer membrane protein assembly factor BamC